MIHLAFHDRIIPALKALSLEARMESYGRQMENSATGRWLVTWLPYCYLIALSRVVVHVWHVVTCRVIGHDLHSETHASTESGVEIIECRRCGVCWSHIYY